MQEFVALETICKQNLDIQVCKIHSVISLELIRSFNSATLQGNSTATSTVHTSSPQGLPSINVMTEVLPGVLSNYCIKIIYSSFSAGQITNASSANNLQGNVRPVLHGKQTKKNILTITQ